MPRTKIDLTTKLKAAIVKMKDTNIIVDGSNLFCKKCSERVKFADHTINARLREHVNSNFHKKNLEKQDQTLLNAGIEKQKKLKLKLISLTLN